MKMKITAEQRNAWAENTANDQFNSWFNPQVRNRDGTLNLDSLYFVAARYGVHADYHHLNPGQQRMNIGNRLRARVPASEYEG
jgi:hypothetical protein